MRIMVLHIVFKQSLALFPSVGLSDRSRYFKLNDELPLSTESILGHARILYDTMFLNTIYCVKTNDWVTRPRALMSSNQIRHLKRGKCCKFAGVVG